MWSSSGTVREIKYQFLHVIPQMQVPIGNILELCITDAGYRGHNAPSDYKFKVYTDGQKRRVMTEIKREFKRRAAIEQSSATSRNITAWAATTSPMPALMPATPCSPPPATTSAACSRG
jgi:IS5 family transposase